MDPAHAQSLASPGPVGTRTVGSAEALEGMIISRRELQSRWSYSELTGRFAPFYANNHVGEADRLLMARIQQGVAYDDLDRAAKDMLAHWCETGFRSDFSNALRNWYDTFRCERWTKDRLLRIGCLAVFDPLKQERIVPLLSFLASARTNPVTGEIDPGDPRIKADSVPFDQPFVQAEPLIAGHWDNGEEVLWEGYFRATLFCRAAGWSDTILVWVPHQGNWPGKPDPNPGGGETH